MVVMVIKFGVCVGMVALFPVLGVVDLVCENGDKDRDQMIKFKVLAYGSVPLKTYPPDGDIDLKSEAFARSVSLNKFPPLSLTNKRKEYVIVQTDVSEPNESLIVQSAHEKIDVIHNGLFTSFFSTFQYLIREIELEHDLNSEADCEIRCENLIFKEEKSTSKETDLKQMLMQSNSPVPPELARHEGSKFKPGSIMDGGIRGKGTDMVMETNMRPSLDRYLAGLVDRPRMSVSTPHIKVCLHGSFLPSIKEAVLTGVSLDNSKREEFNKIEQ
ncbi:hypothetical protein Tco_1213483, partial [Tanacetum coccineum]